MPLPGMKQQMAVLATYTDGTVRDVSAEAFLESSNTEVATVDKHGLVTAVRRGETAMLARYEGAYAAATLVVMGDRSGFAWQDVAEYNYIDTLVYEKLKQVKILPSDLCTDAEFIRRLYLDLTGLPPQPEEVARLPGRQAAHARSSATSWSTSWSAAPISSSTGRTSGPTCCRSTASSWARRGQGVPRLDPQGRRRQHALRQVRLQRS